ncbi:putative methyltransferase [Anaerotruncus sp. CAG:390]|nr:putative methyltransferase [Anaerotruncus sp. CAG:390]
MKAERNFAKVTVTDKGARWLGGGHPWLYESDIAHTDPDAPNGGLVDVVSGKEKYIGTGFLSEASKIRVRLISRNANDRFDADFWRRRAEYAWNYRLRVMGDGICACRVIFGESDGFPGLTVDRFGDILVSQITSYGMEMIKDTVYRVLTEVIRASGETVNGIFERNDLALRTREGLEEGKGWYRAEWLPEPGGTSTVITENGIKYFVDFENGQKTGFFLDQKFNRLAVARLSHGLRVLDCCTHTGSFALNAARGGAAAVTAVDISEDALSVARKNAAMNGLDGIIDFRAADIFDFLPTVTRGEYDMVILDPPAFTKSRRTVDNAFRGYREINTRAMRALPRGGYFATCSCSHFMPNPLFVTMLGEAARDADVGLRQIEVRQQACDHPILWNVPETDYLKFYIFQVV